MTLTLKATKVKGFTLIELVMVIVILGILSATVLPKFFNLQSKATAASLKALSGAIKSGSNLVYLKAIIANKQIGNNEIDIDGNGTLDIKLRAGFPRVADSCSRFTADLKFWIDLKVNVSCDTQENYDWLGVVQANKFHFIPKGFESINDNCYVTYTTASEYGSTLRKWIDKDSAGVIAVTSGC